MGTRLQLDTLLRTLLGNNHTYYQCPESIKMEYPCIRYSKKPPKTIIADNLKYQKHNCYELIVISKTPDHPVIDSLMDLPYCTYSNHYVADNLHHDVLTIYY